MCLVYAKVGLSYLAMGIAVMDPNFPSECQPRQHGWGLRLASQEGRQSLLGHGQNLRGGQGRNLEVYKGRVNPHI